MPRDSRTQPRRHITCHRHPAESVTGFCASCLRDRLAFLEPSTTVDTEEHEVSDIVGRGDPSSSLTGELRRCKSYSNRKCGVIAGVSEQRRKSCDVAVRDTLSHLFNRDDDVEIDSTTEVNKVESKNLGFVEMSDKPRKSSRVAREAARLIISDDEKVMEEDLKTMKEHIEIECQSRRESARDLKDIAESFWSAASVFSRKLKKWSQKQQKKNRIDSYSNRAAGNNGKHFPQSEKISVRGLKERQSEIGDFGLGRRSCDDVDPRRFSVDTGRISFDDPRFSFDEHRASWDGYMIARTIPRLAPMLSVIEDVMLAPINRFDNRGTNEMQRDSIIEDDTACCSDSSSSQMRNSFDCSSSSKSSHKKTAIGGEVDEISKFLHADKSNVVNSHMKAKISQRGDANDVKFGRWKKWKNNFGFKQRDVSGNFAQPELEDAVINVDGYPNLTRSGSCVSGRQIVKKGGEDCVLDRTQVSKQSAVVDNGLLRFHLTPQWGCRKSKSGKRMSMNSPMAAKNTHSMI
ncbi:protein OCTOPUS-like [Impatiens glandulifera]|uniref:protein OCTOPUS-like n=1 Tax=Impatiens glandulifera TaxID=253017 RepID=UPI001FB15D8B|nr:protein OCTOPUS-like [Impatiens glandulifera]